MRRKTALPELLAPAGDYDALVAAILGGADAVYVGGAKFGARAYAKNFSEEELESAVRLCHASGVRLYVTLNTLIFDKELDEATEYAKRLHAIGIDALIVADLGVLTRIREAVPELELHASTQMGAHNTEGVNFASSLGCSRVVLARECTSRDIKTITERSDAEIEVFLHGALCVCHSGQCLFSSLVGGRSGNRGECAQPCRLPYNGNKYVLSLKDLSLSQHVEELIASGVASLKIEGRMKSPDYVYEVTRIYRELLDRGRSSNSDERKRLAQIFSRGGFTDGYFVGNTEQKMTGVRTDEDKRTSREISGRRFELPRLSVSAEASFIEGERSRLTLKTEVRSRLSELGKAESSSLSVTVFGDVPDVAENAPLTEDGVRARLAKMGNTIFALNPEDVHVTVSDGINLSPSKINALRRDAVAELEKKLSVKLDRILKIESKDSKSDAKSIMADGDKKRKKFTTALFFKKDTLAGVLRKTPQILKDIDLLFVPLPAYCGLSEQEAGAVGGVYLPPIVFESEWDAVVSLAKQAREKGARYALIGNVSHLALARAAELIPVGDFRLNVTNKISANLYTSLGVSDLILSPELTLPQARDIGGGVITLGRIPLMLTERCFIRENFGCDLCGKAALTDRRGAKFPMLSEYNHRNIIFNSAPTYMGDKAGELSAAGICHEHFIFSSESVAECIMLLESYKKGERISVLHRRIGKR